MLCCTFPDKVNFWFLVSYPLICDYIFEPYLRDCVLGPLQVFVFHCIGQWRHLQESHTIMFSPISFSTFSLHNPNIVILAWQTLQSIIMSWSCYPSPMLLATVIYHIFIHSVPSVFLQLSLECIPWWATSSTMMLWVARGRSPTRRASTVCIPQITLKDDPT